MISFDASPNLSTHHLEAVTSETTSVIVEQIPGGGGDGTLLVQIHGGKIGRRFPIRGDLTLGRDEASSIVLDDPSVSRSHARITMKDGMCVVSDLGSTNGTAVNEVSADEPIPLKNGDQLRVGGIWFKCIAGDELEQRYHEEIHRLAVSDGLTGLHNRRYFDDFVDREMARAKRRHIALSVALIDVDRFKGINDEYGHLAGDTVLRELAGRMSREIRREELLARFGGEEFVVVFPDTTLEDAIEVCERLRHVVEGEGVTFADDVISVTVSIGVASTTGGLSVEELLKAADDCLFEAKDAGRNQTRPARAT